MQAPACRLRVRAISTLSLSVAFAVAVPQFAAARDAAIDADGVTISQQVVPSGIVLVISEGIFALEESWSEAPALARLAATGVRFSDVVSSSPCAAESLQALETSRWTRERPASTENTRLIELFAAAGWSVDQVTGSDPVAAGASLGSRLDAGGGAPFLMIVKVPPSDSGRVQLGDSDPYLNEVESALAARSLTESTLVAFMATHGVESRNGSEVTCSSLSAAALSVPLLLRWPAGWPAGMLVGQTVSLIDVLPTLAAAAQIATPASAEGQSLIPLMLAPQAPSSLGYQRRPVFAYLVGNADRAAVIDGGWKLIRRHTPEGVTHALYDHVSDRDDEHDITARHPDLTARMIRRLDRWLAAPGTGRNPVS